MGGTALGFICSFTYSFVNSVIKYLLSTYYVPALRLGIGMQT